MLKDSPVLQSDSMKQNYEGLVFKDLLDENHMQVGKTFKEKKHAEYSLGTSDTVFVYFCTKQPTGRE